MLRRLGIFASILLGTAGCAQIAIWMAEKKVPQESHTQVAQEAKRVFWSTLHHHQIQNIPKAEQLLMRAYLQNTNDPTLAAYIAFIHIWRLTERDLSHPNPLIVNEIHLAQDYFEQALNLDPQNPIYLGFLGDSYLISGQIFSDKKAETKGYFMLKEAIAKWPEFNYFTAGYPMSSLPAESKYFKEGLEWQWNTLDLCARKTINRKNPDFSPFMIYETETGKKRACWNSRIAPHNFEGFFMNMGDMLVKSGDWQTAIIIYNNAKLSKTYEKWPFRDLLEARIRNAKRNVYQFNQTHTQATPRIMFNSGHGCMACHQMN